MEKPRRGSKNCRKLASNQTCLTAVNLSCHRASNQRLSMSPESLERWMFDSVVRLHFRVPLRKQEHRLFLIFIMIDLDLTH